MFRRTELPPMPEGYYSCDQPNPNLRAFVEAHLQERPYDPSCAYNDDWSCPITPPENRLKLAIRAGERMKALVIAVTTAALQSILTIIAG